MFDSVDEYLEQVSDAASRAALSRLREIIRDELPDATEVISYGMPGYKGPKYVVGFAAFKKHCSLFPTGIVDEFADELAGFTTSKGTVQFTPDRPLPEDLVRRIVRASYVRSMGGPSQSVEPGAR